MQTKNVSQYNTKSIKKDIDCVTFKSNEDLRVNIRNFMNKNNVNNSDIINIESNFLTGECLVWFLGRVYD